MLFAAKKSRNVTRFSISFSVFSYQLGRDSDSLRAGRFGDRIPVGARFSAPVQTGLGSRPASCTMGTGSLLGVKRPGRGADHHPHLQCRGLKLGRAIPLPTLRALVANKGGNFTVSLPINYILAILFTRTFVVCSMDVCGAREGRRRSVGLIVWKMKNYCIRVFHDFRA